MATAANGQSVATEGTEGAATTRSTSVVGPPRVPLNQVYALPAPIRTFPLPSFYPNNPISLLHLVYAWLKQILSPPPAEPSVVHIGIWDPDTRSVHVVDSTSVRALWEQGFFGKGSLSRSEPNWLKRELARLGSPQGKTVSEVRTESRREERRLAKWERAKTELEAIERQRIVEAAAQSTTVEERGSRPEVNGHPEEPQPLATTEEPLGLPHVVTEAIKQATASFEQRPKETEVNGAVNGRSQEPKSPLGPSELLALPNSFETSMRLPNEPPKQMRPPTGPIELLALPNSLADLVTKLSFEDMVCDVAETNSADVLSGAATHAGEASAFTREGEQGHAEPLDRTKSIFLPYELPSLCFTPSKRSAGLSSAREDEEESHDSKRQKSVRFSPRMESTTIQLSDPLGGIFLNGKSSTTSRSLKTAPESTLMAEPGRQVEVQDREHFQLSPEEAFFLVFSLGALKVVDRETDAPICTERLLSLFRSHSYFPPSASLRPDDPFLVNYAVYHHFRSLGWVPRHGIKFGVDWILYQRGPVFDHSEFGIMVMPAFSRWDERPQDAPKKSWSWLMGVNRVLSHVLKSLVLVYVDIPTPLEFDNSMQEGGIAAALTKYKIREIMVRRFSANRNR